MMTSSVKRRKHSKIRVDYGRHFNDEVLSLYIIRKSGREGITHEEGTDCGGDSDESAVSE